MSFKNITIKIDEETYRQARIRAAERNTSVSAMVRQYLETLSEAGEVEKQRAEDLYQRILTELWERSDERDRDKPGSVGPIRREEIYEERLR